MQFISVMAWPDTISLGRTDNKSIDGHGDHSRSEPLAHNVVSSLKQGGFGMQGETYPLDGYVIYGFDDRDTVAIDAPDEWKETYSRLFEKDGDNYIVSGMGINYLIPKTCSDKSTSIKINDEVTITLL